MSALKNHQENLTHHKQKFIHVYVIMFTLMKFHDKQSMTGWPNCRMRLILAPLLVLGSIVA